jgi:hypothetical protein
MTTFSSDEQPGRHSLQAPATFSRRNVLRRDSAARWPRLFDFPALLLVIVSVVASPAVIAEADDSPRQFEIELLIFRNLVQNDAGELWPVDFSDWFEESADPEQPGTVTETAVTWLPKSQFRLSAQRNALARSAPYRPIAHLAWRQVVPSRQRAKPVVLAGRQHRPDRAYVDGLVRVAVERYLHLDLDLKLHLPASAAQASSDDYEYGVAEIRLRQQRRMRSKELHYFDHPRFGVIALITPYKPVQAAPETDTPAAPPAQP